MVFPSVKGTLIEHAVKVRMEFDFNLGLTGANTLRASNAFATAEHQRYAAARHLIEEQARNAWQSHMSATETAEFLSIQADIARAFLAKARAERELGQRSLVDVLAGEVALIEAQSDATAAQARVITSAYSILGVMGQLSLDTLGGAG